MLERILKRNSHHANYGALSEVKVIPSHALTSTNTVLSRLTSEPVLVVDMSMVLPTSLWGVMLSYCNLDDLANFTYHYKEIVAELKKLSKEQIDALCEAAPMLSSKNQIHELIPKIESSVAARVQAAIYDDDGPLALSYNRRMRIQIAVGIICLGVAIGGIFVHNDIAFLAMLYIGMAMFGSNAMYWLCSKISGKGQEIRNLAAKELFCNLLDSETINSTCRLLGAIKENLGNVPGVLSELKSTEKKLDEAAANLVISKGLFAPIDYQDTEIKPSKEEKKQNTLSSFSG